MNRAPTIYLSGVMPEACASGSSRVATRATQKKRGTTTRAPHFGFQEIQRLRMLRRGAGTEVPASSSARRSAVAEIGDVDVGAKADVVRQIPAVVVGILEN